MSSNKCLLTSCAEEITLDIENVQILVKKKVLIDHSDYFKAMLGGNFVESSQTLIKLEGVDLNSMNIILRRLVDDSHAIEPEDVLQVLETACMLQFEQIQKSCIHIITEILEPHNCIEVWLTAERLDIRPLYLKAKCMALQEFMQICDNDCMHLLNWQQIRSYLGNSNLATDCESHVLKTAINWWHKNKVNVQANFLQLLLCVNFIDISDGLIQELIANTPIREHPDIVNGLKCYMENRLAKVQIQFPPESSNIAQKISQTENRMCLKIPCVSMLIWETQFHYAKYRKRIKYNETVEIFDQRRAKYQMINEHDCNLIGVYFDTKLKQFKTLFKSNDINIKCQSLNGFEIVAYKSLIALFGGEYVIGRGVWNRNLWIFDTLREKWHCKVGVPYPRRHFEACVVGDFLYVIGGTGLFRVNQDNMFWYNFKEDRWSDEILLPCTGRQVKCCNFRDQLLLIDLSNKCGHVFNQENSLWNKIDICNNEISLQSLNVFSAFTYKNRIFLKGNILLELQLSDQKLEVVRRDIIRDDVICDIIDIESVVCNNVVYTQYKTKGCDQNEGCDRFTLETYDLITGTIDHVFRNKENNLICISGKHSLFNSVVKLFSLHHYSMTENDALINDHIFS